MRLQQRRLRRLPQRVPQWLLTHEDHLERRRVVDRRTDQQANVGQRVDVQQVSLVENDQQRSFRLTGLRQNLFEQAILAATGNLVQLADQQLQHSRGRQVGQVKVHRLPSGTGQLVHEPLQQGALADAAGSGDQPHGTVFGHIAKASETLLHPLVWPQGVRRQLVRQTAVK